MFKVTDIIINQDSNILDALSALNRLNEITEISSLILFVFDKEGAIIGSLTDGDIRRSLAIDKDLNKKIGEVCFKNFHYKVETSGYIELEPERKKGIKVIPILNKDRTLSRIIDLNKNKSSLPLECMIMAGGRGKRLSPLTDSIPKPMLPLGDKPIIEHNIDRLIAFGIQKIYISVNYLGEQIQEYFGDGSKKGISIEYIWEEKALGTAGALSLVNKFETAHILLLNSDLFTNVDFEDLYLDMISQQADMVVASTEYKVDVPYAIFETNENQVMDFKEKPSYIYHSNAGIYMFKRELLKMIPTNEFYNITDLMEEIVKEGYKLIHNPIIGYWIDIGSPTDYKKAQEFVKHIK